MVNVVAFTFSNTTSFSKETGPKNDALPPTIIPPPILTEFETVREFPKYKSSSIVAEPDIYKPPAEIRPAILTLSLTVNAPPIVKSPLKVLSF